MIKKSFSESLTETMKEKWGKTLGLFFSLIAGGVLVVKWAPYWLVLLIHVIVSIALIVIVLLQKGKGASIGSVFGGSSQTLFGATGGTTFMHKVTVASAVIFMITCLGLGFRVGTPKSIMSGVSNQPVQSTQPASPEAPPANVPTPPAANPAPSK